MKKLRLIIAAIATVFILGGVPALAQPAPTNTVPPATQNTNSGKCGNTKTQLIACDGKTGIETIGNLIKLVVSVMTVLIGITATGGLAYAAILYASAQDDQSKVASAITIIRNIVIGILLYGFTIAIINWLIPGGVIG
jgi:hypothetical protein